MPETFDSNQGGARFLFSIVSFRFLSLFRLVPLTGKFFFGLAGFPFFAPVLVFPENFRARIASERRLPIRSTPSIPDFVPLQRIFTFPK
jgi:hypothetical protein